MKYKSIYFIILFSCIITFKDNTYAHANETANSNITTSSAVSIENNNITNLVRVSTADEFIEGLSNGCDIILDNNISLNMDKKFNTDTPISIDTNGYGITLTQKSQIEFNGPFKFFGGSNTNPIFKGDAYTLLTLHNSYLDINNDNSVGIYDDDNFFINLYNCSISINGNNSIGINSKMDIDSDNSDLNFNKFFVNGANSTGIKSTKKVNIFSSELNCSGQNSELVDAPEVIFDCCDFDSIPENCTVINRQASLINSNLNYQAAINSDKVYLLNTVSFVLKDKSNEGFPDSTITLDVLWNDDSNYNKIGQYVIKGQVINPYPKIYAEGFPDVVNATISVKDPNALDITHIQSIYTSYDTTLISIDFLKPHLASENNILYCSVDNGKTWGKYSDEEIGDLYDFDSTQLNIYYLEFNKDYLFQYVLADGTKSNLLKININSDGTYISSAMEGDRDSGDLGSITPPVINPDNNSNSTDSNGSSNNSNISNNDSNNGSDIKNKTSNNSNIVIMNSNSESPTFTNGALEEQNNPNKNIKILSKPAINTETSISSKDVNNNDISSQASNSSESFSNSTESAAADINKTVTSNAEINKESYTKKEEDVLNNETSIEEAYNSNDKSHSKIVALGAVFITLGGSIGTLMFIKKRKL